MIVAVGDGFGQEIERGYSDQEMGDFQRIISAWIPTLLVIILHVSISIKLQPCSRGIFHTILRSEFPSPVSLIEVLLKPNMSGLHVRVIYYDSRYICRPLRI